MCTVFAFHSASSSMYLSRNFPAVPSPLQVVAGSMTQAAYIKAFKDLAGSR
jgi:hypothetical protein